jgi:hypothetical protein
LRLIGLPTDGSFKHSSPLATAPEAINVKKENERILQSELRVLVPERALSA